MQHSRGYPQLGPKQHNRHDRRRESVAVVEKAMLSLLRVCRPSILGMSLDTDPATGMTMLQILGAVGEYERSLMLEHQREGIAKAEGSTSAVQGRRWRRSVKLGTMKLKRCWPRAEDQALAVVYRPA